MSRGPGVWQRKILEALTTQEYVFLWDILPRSHTRGQRFACRRAAQRLANRGLVILEPVNGDVWVISRNRGAEVSHINATR
jgi:hypothetical protein